MRGKDLAVFGKLWIGALPLATAFCQYLVIGGFIVLLGVALVGGTIVILFPATRTTTYAIGFVLFWLYLLIASVGTWRSSRTADRRSRAIAARAVIVLLAIWFLLNLFNENGIVPILKGTWQPGGYLRDSARK